MTDAAAPRAATVRLDRVTKRFGAVVAVDDVTLDLPAGRLVTLLGPSGCGKTTALRIVAGLERPTSGAVFIDGDDVTRQPASARDVTMVFQSYALFPHLSVFDNIAYGLRIGRMPHAGVAREVGAALELVGLPGVGDRFPSQLSGGQQQRVALARALVMKPKVLLFDEPLSNLDAKLRRRVRAEIRDLQQRLGITTLYVTHDQAEALSLSDTIIVMNRGRVEQIGAPAELYRRPANRFVADFVGEANLLEGRYAAGEVTVGPFTFAFRQPGAADGPVVVVARPEAITVERGADGHGLPGTIRTAFFMGMTAEYLIDTAAGTLTAIEPLRPDGVIPAGAAVSVRFEDAGLYLLWEGDRSI